MARVEINFERLGITYTDVPRVRIDQDYLTPVDGFEFDLVDEDPKKLRGLVCEPCTITINGALQMIGSVERRRVGHNGATNTFMGRDYRALLANSQLQADSAKKGETVHDLVKRICAPWGITQIFSDTELDMREVRTGRSKVSGQIPKSLEGLTVEDFKAKEGEGVLQFLTRIVTRNGGTIQCSNSRTALNLSTPIYRQGISYRIYRPRNAPGGNVIVADQSSEWDEVPTVFTAKGRAGTSKENRSPTVFNYDYFAQELELYAPEIVERITDAFHTSYIKPGTIGDPLRRYVPFFMEDNEARNKIQLERSAFRRVAEKLQKTLIYTATISGIDAQDPFEFVSEAPVEGIAAEGIQDEKITFDLEGNATSTAGQKRVWATNTIVQVNDELADVDSELWIRGVSLNADASSGDTTEITAIRLGTLLL